MIPKKIHYCWFGGNSLPEKDRRCIESWKKYCPDYEIIRWDESNYDLSRNKFMKQAYEAKKWGFVPDFARLDIIYNEGGIYLDTDVEIIRNLDELLINDAFMGFEGGEAVSPGLGFGAVPKHETIKQLMGIYENLEFIKADGSYETTPSPIMNTQKMIELGCIINDKKQTVRGITIYPSEYLCPKDYVTGKIHITSNTFTIHHYNASWMSKKQKRRYRLRKLIGKNLYDKMVKIKNSILSHKE